MSIGDIGGGFFAETMTMNTSFTKFSGSGCCTKTAGTTGVNGGGLSSSLTGGSFGGLFGGGAGETGFSFSFGGSFAMADGSSLNFDFAFSSGQGGGCCHGEEEATQTQGEACCHAHNAGEGTGVADILEDWMEETLNKSIGDLLSELQEDRWKDLLGKTLEQLLGDNEKEHGCGCADEAGGGFNLADLLGGDNGPQTPMVGNQALAGDDSVIVQIVGDNNDVQINLGGEQPEEEEYVHQDPLMLDLDGQGIKTTGVENGAMFDINADGQETLTSVDADGTGFLALDRNDNGVIDDGTELFGDQNGAAHGFDELSRYDSNGDGVINAEDPVFDDLRILQFDDSGEQQLSTLEEHGIASLNLNNQYTDQQLNETDTKYQLGTYERADGSERALADVLLGYRVA